MIDKELLDIYDRLNKHCYLLIKIIDFGNYISLLGVKIIFLGFLMVVVLNYLDAKLSSILRLGVIMIFFAIPTIFVYIGIKLSSFIIGDISYNEIQFIRTIEFLKDIEEYKETDDLRKKLIKIRLSRNIDTILASILPTNNLEWKNKNDNGVHTLKKNLEYGLSLDINQGEEESINRVFFIIEKFARYIINPNASTDSFLDELNSAILDFGQRSLLEKPIFEFFDKMYIKYAIICILFSYLIIKILSVSTDTALITGLTLYGILIMVKKN